MTNEHHILHAAGQALRRTTGLAADILADAAVELAANRRTYRFRAEVKAVDRFETPALVKAQGKPHRKPTLLVAPYITREIAERCRQLRLPFIDTAGNAYLEGPGLFVYVTGNPKPAELRQVHFRAVNPAGLQVVFALVCRPALIHTTYREIAARAAVALGTVGPVIKDLEARGYLRFHKETERKLLDPQRMVEEWVTHYPIALRPKLNLQRFRADPERLQQTSLLHRHAYWGGEPAAERFTRYLKPDRFTLYAREPIAGLIAAGRMRADPAGNVEILDAFWNFEPDKDFPDIVPPVLAYADLLATGDGRNAEAARLLYEQRIAPAFHPAG